MKKRKLKKKKKDKYSRSKLYRLARSNNYRVHDFDDGIHAISV